MPATVRGRLTGYFAEAGTHTLATPSGTQAGDAILIWASTDEVSALDGAIPAIDSVSAAAGWTTESGWTMEQGDTTNVRGTLFHLPDAVGSGDDELIIDFPGAVEEPVAYIALAIADAGTPVVGDLTSVGGTSNTTHTPDAISGLASGDYLSVLFIAIDANSAQHNVTAPSNYGNVQEAEPVSSTSNAVMGASMERTLTGVTSITPGAITWTGGDQSIAAHVAVPYVPAPSTETHRFYLANQPAFWKPNAASGFLEDNAEAANARQLLPAPAGAADDVTRTETANDTAHWMLLGQWVSHPASAAGTLDVAHEAVIAFSESDAAANMNPVLTVYVLQGDTTTSLGTAINRSYGSIEMPTSAEGIALIPSGTVESEAPRDFEAGDRIVVEVIARGTTTSTTPYSATLYFGGTADPDLADGDTNLSRPAWIDLEISPGVTFPEPPTTEADAGLATGTGAAHQPTADTDESGTSASAGLASGTGSAGTPTASIVSNASPTAGLASGTGAAHTASAVGEGTGIRMPANPAEALWIGEEPGKNHFNLGIGQDGEGPDGDWEDDVDHLDYDIDVLEAGFTDPGHWDLTEDGDVYHRVRADAGRTSGGTDHPRTELRELDQDGDLAAWDGRTGWHKMWGTSVITDVTEQRPWVCFFQIHDESSDLVRVQCEGTTGQTTGLDLRVRWTPPGTSENNSDTLPGWENAYDLGDEIEWEIWIGGETSADDGRLRIWINGVLVWDDPDMGAEGCYFKAGDYLQSNVDVRGEEPDDTAEVVIRKGSFGHWHTGWAANTEPEFTGDLIAEQHRFYLANEANDGLDAPAALAFWVNDDAATTPQLLATEPTGSATSAGVAETSASATQYTMVRQFISHPATAPGTLAGEFTLTAGVQESDAAANFVTLLGIWVTQGDTASIRGSAALPGGFGSVEWLTTATALQLGAELTNEVEFLAGDRIVVEIGYIPQNTETTSFTGTVHYGGTGTPDLVVGGTDFSRPGWIDLQITPGVDFLPVAPTTEADAGLAAGTGAALAPTVDIISNASPAAGHASGTGAALQPTLDLDTFAEAGLASGTGAAHQPAVSVDGNTSAPAGLASGVGAALEPAVTSDSSSEAGHAAGTGTASDLVPNIGGHAGVAAGAGAAHGPSLTLNSRPAAGHASGAGAAYGVQFSGEDPLGFVFLRNQFPDDNARASVEAAWGADLTLDADEWEWSDLSQDVRYADGIFIRIGRSNEASTTQPAECTVTLDNRQGLYALGGQSPNWPYVRRNTPIRVRVTLDVLGEEWQALFVGYATKWAPSWDKSGRNAITKLEANGALRRLEQRSAPVLSALRRAYLGADSVLAYWPCEEPAGAQTVASALLDQPPMSIRGDAEQPFPKFATNEDFACSLPLPEVALTSWRGVVPRYTDTTGRIQVRWLMVAPIDPMNGTECVILSIQTSGTISRWDVVYVNGNGGMMTIRGYDGAGEVVATQSNTLFNADNSIRRWSLDLRQDGDDIDYQVTSLGLGYSTVGAFPGTPTATGQTLGVIQAVTVCPDRDFDDVAIGHILVQNNAPDGFNLAEKEQFEAFAGELVTDRITRLCAENNVPVTIVGTSEVRMGVQSVADLLTLLRECEAVDQGLLVDGLHSGLTYICRSEREGRTPDLVLDAAQGEPARELVPVDDDQRTLNRATAQRTRGVEVTYEDADGPMGTAAVGTYDDSVKVNSHEDLDVGDYASWLVNQGTVTGYRYPRLRLDLAHKHGLIDAWLAVLPSARVDVLNAPAVRTQLPDVPIELLLEGYEQTLTQMTWDVELNCSSYEPWRVGLLAEDTGDEDAYLLRAAPDSSVLAADAAEGANTLSVTTTGPRWTTEADDFPADISVGGIRVRVTGVTGTGSTQTFAVDSDDVVKALPAGLPVELWRPTVIAL